MFCHALAPPVAWLPPAPLATPCGLAAARALTTPLRPGCRRPGGVRAALYENEFFPCIPAILVL